MTRFGNLIELSNFCDEMTNGLKTKETMSWKKDFKFETQPGIYPHEARKY